METIDLRQPSGKTDLSKCYTFGQLKGGNDSNNDDILPSTLFGIPRSFIFQTLVVLSATMFQMIAVMGFVWPSPTIPKLMAKDSYIKVSSSESTWIVSCLKVGTLMSIIPVGWMMDRLGRKMTLLIGSIPMLLSFILLIVGETVHVLYVFTLISGLSFGLASMTIPMYIAEISSDSIRGYLGVLHTIMGKVGVVYMYSIGPFVTIQEAAWFGIVPVILFICTFAWMPESPYQLLATGQPSDARQSLVRLRGTNAVDDELSRMEVSVRKSFESTYTLRSLFVEKGIRRSLLIVVGLSAIYEMCGSQTVNMYSKTIFEQINCGWDTNFITIVLGLVQLISAIAASSLVDWLGRRPLLLISITGATLANAVTGGYFTLARMEYDVKQFTWVPVVAIMTAMVAYTLGIKSLLSVMTAELFPKHLKAAAGSVCLISMSCFGFGVVFWYRMVTESFGFDYLFYGFTACSIVSLPFIWGLVPETKGKSLDVILEEMENNR